MPPFPFDDSGAEFDPGPVYRRPLRSVPTSPDRILLPLTWKDDRWLLEVDTLFRPMGLVVTGECQRGGIVTEWTVGGERVVPAHRVTASGSRGVSLDVYTFIESLGPDAACRPTFPTLGPGMVMSLTTIDLDDRPYGPPLVLTVWGLRPRYI